MNVCGKRVFVGDDPGVYWNLGGGKFIFLNTTAGFLRVAGFLLRCLLYL